jgi:hypothetical protein
LTASYALDAAESTHVPSPPKLGAVHAFIDQVASSVRRRFITVGIGETVRLSGDTLVGAALEVDGRCVHLSAFSRVSGWQHKAECGLNTTRMQRSSVRARRW